MCREKSVEREYEVLNVIDGFGRLAILRKQPHWRQVAVREKVKVQEKAEEELVLAPHPNPLLREKRGRRNPNPSQRG